MYGATRLHTALAVVASMALALPPHVTAAERSVSPAGETIAESLDISLQPGGILVGQVVDSTGKPMAAQTVSLSRQRTIIATCQSDANGSFSMRGLDGGVYAVSCKEQVIVCRLWSAGAAPPAAQTSLQMTPDNVIVRGQSSRGGLLGRNMILWGAVVAAAIAIPLSLAFPRHSSS